MPQAFSVEIQDEFASKIAGFAPYLICTLLNGRVVALLKLAPPFGAG
ncbi:MAG: hypothetical protein HY785_27925 [Oscillatoriophycideae cyanobacterium NC_groundwater_1537_Pr4_S-0.65um_50_18]|nr:hypothetical protein [Oscillatoriophycideae cyanobacterium NC_groundwater_1537_Pr4_S-0.65um_50_18]